MRHHVTLPNELTLRQFAPHHLSPHDLSSLAACRVKLHYSLRLSTLLLLFLPRTLTMASHAPHPCPFSGDFYLVRSRSGDLVIQVRQVACSAFVTCNKAVRMRYGSSIITFDTEYKYVIALRAWATSAVSCCFARVGLGACGACGSCEICV